MNQYIGDSKKLIFGITGRIVFAILLGLFVLGISTTAGIAISNKFPDLVQILPMGQGFIIQFCFLLFSTLLVVFLGKGSISRYGFVIGKNIDLPRVIIFGLVIGIVSSLAGSIVPGEIPDQTSEASLIEMIIGIWILASIAEEVFTRGLIQGYLSPLVGFGVSFMGFRISLPVLISGLFFGLMHLGILSTGADLFPVVTIVVFAALLGFAAGYHRETSGSLIPAIIIHICGNIGAWLPNAIFRL